MNERGRLHGAPNSSAKKSLAVADDGRLASWKGIAAPTLTAAGVTGTGGFVRVPYRLPDGREHNAKVFARTGRNWWDRRHVPPVPLGLEMLRPGAAAVTRALLIGEGESDTLKLRECFAGTSSSQPPVGVEVIGLPGARIWQRAWADLIADYPLIYVLGDGDEAGRDMNVRVCRDVRWARSVWLPDGEDARSILSRDPRGLDEYLRRADEAAALSAAFAAATTIAEVEALLRGEEIQREA